MQGNFDVAKSLFVEFVGESKVDDMWWVDFIGNPWLTELHNDPEVAAILDQHECELVALREEINTMFQRPEWQH